MSTTSSTSRTVIAKQVIGNLRAIRPQGVRDPGVNGNSSAVRRRGVRDLETASAMSNYNSIVGSANNDLKEIQAILVARRENGKHGAIPPI